MDITLANSPAVLTSLDLSRVNIITVLVSSPFVRIATFLSLLPLGLGRIKLVILSFILSLNFITLSNQSDISLSSYFISEILIGTILVVPMMAVLTIVALWSEILPTFANLNSNALSRNQAFESKPAYWQLSEKVYLLSLVLLGLVPFLFAQVKESLQRYPVGSDLLIIITKWQGFAGLIDEVFYQTTALIIVTGSIFIVIDLLNSCFDRYLPNFGDFSNDFGKIKVIALILVSWWLLNSLGGEIINIVKYFYTYI